MFSNDKNYILIFNGEIYNFNELKNQLKEKGFVFYTKNSDTEVILNGYLCWGEDISLKLNGMWSFIIFDKKKNKIFFSRDRFGEKPIFYYFKNNTLIFSSELQVFKNLDIDLNINYYNLAKYSAHGYFPSDLTPYNNIKKVPAGFHGFFNIDKSNFTIKEYWKFLLEPDYLTKENQWCDRIYSLLENSVKKRLVADVPVGVFLSGGLDSSIITYLAAKNSSSKINTFSIRFQDESFSEIKYSNLISKKFNTNHLIELINSKDINSIFNDFLSKIHEPISDSSLLSFYVLCKLAKTKVKVVLGGDAADELFAGYSTFKAIKYVEILKKYKFYNFFSLIKNVPNFLPTNYSYMNYKFKLQRFFKFDGKDVRLSHCDWLSPLSIEEIRIIFNLKKLNKEEIYSEAINDWDNKNKNLDLVDKSLEFYTNSFLKNQILVKVDRLSMINSLEVRSPFLDYEFIDCVRAIPSKLKYKNGVGKYILKKTFEKNFGKKFTYRNKIGFSAPISNWIKNKNIDFQIRSSKLFNNYLINDKLNEHNLMKNENRLFLWNILMLDNFLKLNNE